MLFKAEMLRLMNLYIPTITINEKARSPWFNKSLKGLNNKKKRLFRVAKRTGSPSAWQKYNEAAKDYNSLKARAKRDYYSTTIPNMLQSNPRRFWKAIKPDDRGSISLCDNTGAAIADSDVPDALNLAFCSVFTKESADALPHFPYFNFPAMEGIEFRAEGIAKVIESLKCSSSCGIDGINAKVLKSTKNVCSSILCIIFQHSLDTGTVPNDWKIGKVIPVFKKGDRSSPGNYRPISLTSICSKIMEHVIYSHVAHFLNSVDFFHPNQHGFRRGHSCESQLALFTHDIHLNLDSNTPTDALFLDFEKAFDKVPHSRLLLKLSRLNIHPLVRNWIECFLSNRKQFVYANNCTSSTSPVLSGVPQGTVLGPLLFLIYINDLPSTVTSVIRLFADDCVVYRPINNLSDVCTLQEDLLRIQDWCTTWLMSLNTSKTVIISFHRRSNYAPSVYKINNCIISNVHSFKYLGLHLSQDLSWTDHVTHIINSANKMLGYLRRNLFMAQPHVRLLAYKTLVRPKLEYACAIFDPHQSNLTKALQSVQNRSARFILSEYSYHTSVSSLTSKLDLVPLASRRRISRLCLYHRFFHTMPRDSRLIQLTHRASRTGHLNAVIPPRTRTTTFHQSFFVRTARDWNGLPGDVALVRDAARFRSATERLP